MILDIYYIILFIFYLQYSRHIKNNLIFINDAAKRFLWKWLYIQICQISKLIRVYRLTIQPLKTLKIISFV